MDLRGFWVLRWSTALPLRVKFVCVCRWILIPRLRVRVSSCTGFDLLQNCATKWHGWSGRTNWNQIADCVWTTLHTPASTAVHTPPHFLLQSLHTASTAHCLHTVYWMHCTLLHTFYCTLQALTGFFNCLYWTLNTGTNQSRQKMGKWNWHQENKLSETSLTNGSKKTDTTARMKSGPWTKPWKNQAPAQIKKIKRWETRIVEFGPNCGKIRPLHK